MSKSATAVKPKLRGYIHQESFFLGLGACLLLVTKSSNQSALVASLVYSFGLLAMLGTSALYHRVQWLPKARSLLKRLDHSAIFILIAGTVTPIAVLSLGDVGIHLLWIIWSVAVVGILQSIFWVSAPKWVTALFYVATGWLVIPYLDVLLKSLGTNNVGFLMAGGIVYTIGAVFYAMKKPNLIPGVFGYHELFHLFTVIGAILHFVVIYRIIS